MPVMSPFLKTISRRDFFNSLAVSLGIFSTFYLQSCSQKELRFSASEYLKKLGIIFTDIQNNESVSIHDGANILADAILSKNRCFLYFSQNDGFPFPLEMNYGIPKIFTELRSEMMLNILREGDAFLSFKGGKIPEAAAKRGVNVIGISSCFTEDSHTQETESILKDPQYAGKNAKCLIESHIPSWDGIFKDPDTSFGVFPVSAPVILALFTAISGEAYARSGGIGLNAEKTRVTALKYLTFFKPKRFFLKKFSLSSGLISEVILCRYCL